MDFAALMSKEIGKAKGTDSQKETEKQSKQPAKKYTRRGEEEAARIAAYNEEQERLRREREERMSLKRKADDEEAERRREREQKKQKLAEESRKKREEEEAVKERERRKKLGLPELPPPGSGSEEGILGEGEKEDDIPDEELAQKFRELEEPVCLFGESHNSRLRRYRRLVQRALTPKPKLSNGPIPTTLEPVPEVEMKISQTIPKENEGRKFLFRQLASYFNMVLSEWEIALAKRDLTVRQSLQGRQAYNAMAQSRDNLKPLFKKLEKFDVDDKMLEPILEIVHKAQQRRYVDANDAYLRLSIGKA